MSTCIYKSRKRRTVGDLVERAIAAHIVGLSRRNSAYRRQRMAIFANDEIGVNINQFGFYEREQLEILFEFLAPLKAVFQDGTAFDIGANIGNHAVYFSRLFRDVHAFEPNPNTFALLCFNAKWAPNVVTHNYGLGDEEGSFELGEDLINVGASSIKNVGDRANAVRVDVHRLDGLPIDSSRLCFIKMDVEGFEPQVLKSAMNLLRERQPLIVLEQHEHEFKGETSESIELLKAAGYSFVWHQNGTASKNQLVRRFFSIKDLFAGRVHRMVAAASVPPNTYPMLIAVPPRFREALSIRN
jgi:FkbM family methyltransferase